MAKKRREPQSLTRMPSGAQQYVRGDTTADRLETLMGAASAEARRNNRRRYSEAESRMDEAFLDEVDRAAAARRTEREGSTQRYAEGGMVRGCKPGQMTGKGFSGSY